MPRRIELSIEGATAIAVLAEDAAPKSSQKVWDALPLEVTLRHLRWGGSAGYILAESLRDPEFPRENRVSIYAPGTLNFQAEYGEVSIAYGPAQAPTPPATPGPRRLPPWRATHTRSATPWRGRSMKARSSF